MATFDQPSSADPNNNIVRNWLTGIGIALVVIVAITFVLHRKETLSPVIAGDESSTTESAVSTTTAPGSITSPASAATSAALPGTETIASTGEAISAADQPAGASVAISSMSLTKRSWVAVKDENGMILGAGLFPADATSGIVPLLRATAAGQRYEAVIYVDDGDKIFDLHRDMLVVSADGSPVGAAFNAQ
jgi:hypothetical protein